MNLLKQEFKKLMGQTSDLRTRLENAIRINQQLQQHVKSDNANIKPLSTQAPSIKLKTDFSNFS